MNEYLGIEGETIEDPATGAYGPNYVATLNDYLGAIEVGACDGDVELLDLLSRQGTLVLSTRMLIQPVRIAWKSARKAARLYSRAVHARVAGNIQIAMKYETEAGQLENDVRKALLAG